MSDRTAVDPRIVEDAADWFGRLQTERSSEATRLEFVRWLTRSPVHVEEFLRVSALHRSLSRELKADTRWLDQVLTEASAAGNVVRLADMERPRTAPISAPSKRWRSASAAAVAVVIGLATFAGIRIFLSTSAPDRHFTTAVGEQRQAILPDGSGVRLNTATEIQVRWSETLRQVELVRGEAIFEVEKDAARPFRVVSDKALVEALGTRFKVYDQQDRTVITVLEGRVAVSPRLSTSTRHGEPRDSGAEVSLEPRVGDRGVSSLDPSAPLHLEAGLETAVTKNGTIAQPAPADIERAIAWTRRRMVFDSDTLETVVAEFNRYNRERLIIAEPSLRERRITGVFNIDDPDAFLALLADLDDIRVVPLQEGGREIRRSATAERDEALPDPGG